MTALEALKAVADVTRYFAKRKRERRLEEMTSVVVAAAAVRIAAEAEAERRQGAERVLRSRALHYLPARVRARSAAR